ncbi:MAG: response regulator [Bacteroidota bacterium]
MRHINILIIDKSLDVIIDLKKSISNYYPYFNVVGETNNPKEALNKIEKLKPEIVFLDLSIENFERYDILNYLHQNHIHTIISTNNPRNAIIGFKFKVLYCIEKPYTLEKLAFASNKIYHELFKSNFTI